jgi:uncharacterized protein (TIGR00645 family)
MDKIMHSILYASRWILAPIYFGLIGALITVLAKFYIDLYHLFFFPTNLLSNHNETTVILKVLGLIDLTLIGGLLLMVMLSGFENFISRTTDLDQKLGWLGKLDANSLKIKVAASIVAISSIHLLQIFMSLPMNPTTNDHGINNRALVFLALHLTFVVSACLMALSDRKRKTRTEVNDLLIEPSNNKNT